MANAKIICDKCEEEDYYKENNNIAITRYYGKYMSSSTSIQLCDKCYKEFMRIYLH